MPHPLAQPGHSSATVAVIVFLFLVFVILTFLPHEDCLNFALSAKKKSISQVNDRRSVSTGLCDLTQSNDHV